MWPLYLSTPCSWEKVGFAWSSNSPLQRVLLYRVCHVFYLSPMYTSWPADSTSSAGLCYGLPLYAVATPAPWRPTSSRLVIGMDNWIVSLECPGPRCPGWYACKVLVNMQSMRQVQCEVSCYPCSVWVSSSFLTSNRCEIGTVVHAAFMFSFLGFFVLCSLFYLSFFGILCGW